MATKIILTANAKHQLDRIADHFEYDGYSDNVARSFQLAVFAVFDRIRVFPRSYPLYDHLKAKGYRKAIIRRYHYIIAYRLSGETAYIEQIYHMKQRCPIA